MASFFMPYIVYIMYSEHYHKHYTGFTSDLPRRIVSHNELGSDWTKAYRPWKLIYTKEFDNKREAMLYEKWLKTGAGRDFIKTLPH
jgi:putative endonuclease